MKPTVPKKEKWFLSSFEAVVFLSTFELAAGSSFFFMEGAVIWYIVELACLLPKKPVFPLLLRRVKEMTTVQKAAGALVLSYLGWDLVTLFYSLSLQDFVPKYKVVFLMLLLCIGILTAEQPKDMAHRALRAVGRAGLTAAALAVIIYLPTSQSIFSLFPIYYTQRLSLRRDYNMFATVLFYGYLVLGFVCILSEHQHNRIAGICRVSVGLLPVLLLSGSRRYLVMLFPVAALFAAMLLKLARGRGQRFYTAAAVTGTIVLVLCLYRAGQSCLVYHSAALMQQPRAQWAVVGETAEQRYCHIGEPSAGSKRKLIWQLCGDELKRFSAMEWIVGKGFCYDHFFLSKSDHPKLLQAYPPEQRAVLSAHGFIIADILCGGLIKLGLGAALWLCLTVQIIQLLFCIPHQGLFCGVWLLTVLCNNLISNRYGFLYDKMFWLLLLFLYCAVPNWLKERKHGISHCVHDDIRSLRQ